jgi:hypothetical protein
MISFENATYDIKYTKNGSPNYFKSGKLIKGKLIPDVVRELLAQSIDPESLLLDDDENKNTITEKICIFCQGYADSGKLLNTKFIHLCKEDYQTKTTGQIAQRVREINAN